MRKKEDDDADDYFLYCVCLKMTGVDLIDYASHFLVTAITKVAAAAAAHEDDDGDCAYQQTDHHHRHRHLVAPSYHYYWSRRQTDFVFLLLLSIHMVVDVVVFGPHTHQVPQRYRSHYRSSSILPVHVF